MSLPTLQVAHSQLGVTCPHRSQGPAQRGISQISVIGFTGFMLVSWGGGRTATGPRHWRSPLWCTSAAFEPVRRTWRNPGDAATTRVTEISSPCLAVPGHSVGCWSDLHTFRARPALGPPSPGSRPMLWAIAHGSGAADTPGFGSPGPAWPHEPGNRGPARAPVDWHSRLNAGACRG